MASELQLVRSRPGIPELETVMKDPFTWVYELRRSYIPDRLWYAAGFGVAGGSAVLDHVLWATDILGAIALLASAYLAYTYVACKVYGRPLPAVEQAASRVRARMVNRLKNAFRLSGS